MKIVGLEVNFNEVGLLGDELVKKLYDEVKDEEKISLLKGEEKINEFCKMFKDEMKVDMDDVNDGLLDVREVLNDEDEVVVFVDGDSIFLISVK